MTDPTEAERIASKLSRPMIEMLRNGFYGEGSATTIGTYRNPSRNALVRRGLVHDDNRWTVLGREVARVLDPRLKTLDELHAIALDEQARREMAEAAEWQDTPAYRLFSATVREVGFRNGLDRLHEMALAENDDREVEAADDREARRTGGTFAAKYLAEPARATSEQVVGAAAYGCALGLAAYTQPAQQPGKRVISRYGQRGLVVRDSGGSVAIGIGAALVTMLREEYDMDWWPDTGPRDPVRITEAVESAACDAYGEPQITGSMYAAIKAAFEAVGLQVIE